MLSPRDLVRKQVEFSTEKLEWGPLLPRQGQNEQGERGKKKKILVRWVGVAPTVLG